MKEKEIRFDEEFYEFEKPTTSYKKDSAFTPRTGLRTSTAYGADGRPMTSVRAAGYSSRGRPVAGSAVFDPLNQATRGVTEKQPELSPEEVVKDLEKRVQKLIEDSAFAAETGDHQQALEKAKEAAKKERILSKQRDQLNAADQAALDLTYCVLFNLASQYHMNQMYPEALNTYGIIVKNKAFSQSGRLRVNMGNIYFEQGKYSNAIKMYRMALDQISNSNREFRLKIMRNIGNAFVKLEQYQDAINSYEAIMEGNPDHHTGFNLIVCYFALGDKDKMKRGFQRLVGIVPPGVEQNDDNMPEFNTNIEEYEVFDEDILREISRTRKMASDRYIILASKLIAPAVEESAAIGFDWMIEILKASPNSHLSSELETAKSLQFLNRKEFQAAIECLKSFEKKDKRLVGTAATNLSFLYFLEGDYENSEHYADVAINNDRYNSKAQTNKGNIYFAKGQLSKARDHYQEVIGTDAACTEAIFNLGLVLKKMNAYDAALSAFEKLYTILRNSPEVIYHIADIHEIQGKSQLALEWFNVLISIVPTDPAILARIGELVENEGDKSQAFHYYSESFRYYPSSINVITWLGAYYVECEVYEQATTFFERAALIEPNEVKWQLMVASCQRRSGNYQQAFETYKKVHEAFPTNIECLRFLVKICSDLGVKEIDEYKRRLDKLEASQGVARIEKQDSKPAVLPQSVNIQVLNTVMTRKKSDPEMNFNEDVVGMLPD